MKILGINFEQHDSGAALIVDGNIISAVNEERFSRKKTDNSVPIESVKYCLKQAGLKPSDLDLVVLSGFSLFKKWLCFGGYYRDVIKFTRLEGMLFFMYSDEGEFRFMSGFKAIIMNFLAMSGFPSLFLVYIKKMIRIKNFLSGYTKKYMWVDHHIGHRASSYFTSGFESCLSVVIEGMDWENTMVVEYIDNSNIKKICSTPWPYSAGYFYELITMLAGYNLYTHAGKITGLAALGDPENAKAKVSTLMWVEGMELRISPLIFTLRQYYLNNKQLPAFLADYSIEDLAAAFQSRLEECVVEIVEKAVRLTNSKNIALAGGVCANVKLNQKIHEIEGVENVYVHPAMSDAGQALGVALSAAAELDELKVPISIPNVFFGPEYSDADIEKELNERSISYTKENDIYKCVGQLLADGWVVGRFTGRMEYGPRALGNRSVLYQTTDPSVNGWLNKKLKRTEFMPFAPASIEEESSMLYKNIQGAEYAAGFMTITFECSDWMKENCPAVVHVDGTARPQIVRKKDNPELYAIITEYNKISGIPAIINTSFNMHGEPIVLTPSDAIKSFLQGGLEYLAIGSYIVPHPDNKVKNERGLGI